MSRGEGVKIRLIVIGAPGAGKGTQAMLLAKHYNVPHVSTGELLREHILQGDQVGQEVRSLMKNGRLVPDDIVIGLVKKFVRDGNFIFDGFPRTVRQAEILDTMLKAQGMQLDKVVYVSISDEIIIGRMSGRQTCVNCGAIYNTEHNPPIKPEVCDICDGGLRVREDDSAPVVKRRLDSYYSLTEPIIEHYRKMGQVFEISGSGKINDITEAIINHLNRSKR